MTELAKLIVDLGFGPAISVMVFVAFFFLLKWVLKVSSDQLVSMHEERKSWIKAQEGFNIQLQGIQEQMHTNIILSKSFYEQVQESHKAQREEHAEIASALGRINGYKN